MPNKFEKFLTADKVNFKLNNVKNRITRITSTVILNAIVRVEGQVPTTGIHTCYFQIEKGSNFKIGVVDANNEFWWF